MPLSKRGAASSSPETNCDEADASSVTEPPASAPVPCTVNGTAPRPSSSMTAPSSRRAARTGPTGRCEARGSPWNRTLTPDSAATGGAKRMTVPALPTSTLVSSVACPGHARDTAAGGTTPAEPPDGLRPR